LPGLYGKEIFRLRQSILTGPEREGTPPKRLCPSREGGSPKWESQD